MSTVRGGRRCLLHGLEDAADFERRNNKIGFATSMLSQLDLVKSGLEHMLL